jgi:hypothetical protein
MDIKEMVASEDGKNIVQKEVALRCNVAEFL